MKLTNKARVGITLLAFATCGTALIALPACETVKGAGRDVSNLGDAVTDGSDSVQDSIDGKK
jgi:predicted small secreted protein